MGKRFEDTNGVTRGRNSKKGRQNNDPKINVKKEK